MLGILHANRRIAYELVQRLTLLLSHLTRHDVLAVYRVLVGLLGHTSKVLPSLRLNTSLLPDPLHLFLTRLPYVHHWFFLC